MAQVFSIFSQILGLFPRRLFEAAVANHGGMRHARGFSYDRYCNRAVSQATMVGLTWAPRAIGSLTAYNPATSRQDGHLKR